MMEKHNRQHQNPMAASEIQLVRCLITEVSAAIQVPHEAQGIFETKEHNKEALPPVTRRSYPKALPPYSGIGIFLSYASFYISQLVHQYSLWKKPFQTFCVARQK